MKSSLFAASTSTGSGIEKAVVSTTLLDGGEDEMCQTWGGAPIRQRTLVAIAASAALGSLPTFAAYEAGFCTGIARATAQSPL